MEQYNNLFGYEDYKIKKPIRLIELFGGYGSQALALEYLHKDFEHWKLCEWNYKSCHAYRRFHMPDDKNNYAEGHSEEEIIDFLSSKGISSDWNNPMTKKQIIMMNKKERERAYSDIIATHNLVNIMQVHADDLEINDTENYDYMMFYSFPCVPKGTLILTDKGYKEVQDIVSGDIVMTHKNRLRKVVKTMKRKSENYIIVNGVGATNLILTPNHPLYIFRNNNFQWIKAQDLKNTDYLTYNIPNEERKADLSDNMLWLLGRYVADGHYNKYSSNSINFSIGFKKENEFIDHIPSQFKDRFKRFVKKGVYDYRIADKWLKDFCLFNFHTGSKIKIIPEWVIELPKDQLQSFFDGYMSGDGHKRIRNNHPQYMFSTVSQALLYSLQRIVFKLYHRITTINIRKKERFSDCYNGQFSLGNKYLHQKIVNNYLLGRIKSVKFIDKPIDVYNFEVEEDNSYTIFNVNVHNCQDLSLAGKRAGMSDTSTRSGLLWEVERILSECEEGHKPQVLIMENVIQVHSQIQMKDFQKWLSRLNELGYQNYWEDLSATDFGIPQTRVRTIMVSVLGDYTYHFPKPEKLTLRLKDMLESDVDKKYYLSERQIKAILFSDYAENKNRINAESGVIHTLRARDFKDPQCVKITDATLKGYDEAYDGDGVYTNNIKGKRGTVQHAIGADNQDQSR
jgi:site-specific DNA-cytosine methylase